MSRCWRQRIEIDTDAVRSNLRLFRRVVGEQARMLGVVKADAYGHSAELVAPVVEEEADWLGVHEGWEALRLREIGCRGPILVMGFVGPDSFDGLDEKVHLLVSTPEVLEWAGAYRRRSGVALPVHLKIETGTNRQGVQVDELDAMCRKARDAGLEVVGAATHFANIEDSLEHDFAHHQTGRFEDAVGVLSDCLGGRPQWVHAACSAAALLFRRSDFSLVRVGISMYGHWPSRETELSWCLAHDGREPKLRPVLRWVAPVGQLKDVPAGETVGYGRTWQALRPTRLAILPIGYADGYARNHGNRARVLVRGRPAPVVGRVCMNITMVDVTDVPGVEVGDEVVLIGRQGSHEIPVESLAGDLSTISYEVLARLSSAIPRVEVRGGVSDPEDTLSSQGGDDGAVGT